MLLLKMMATKLKNSADWLQTISHTCMSVCSFVIQKVTFLSPTSHTALTMSSGVTLAPLPGRQMK